LKTELEVHSVDDSKPRRLGIIPQQPKETYYPGEVSLFDIVALNHHDKPISLPENQKTTKLNLIQYLLH